jgi:hypothetical protein
MSRRTDKMASEAAAEANQAAVEPVSEPINPASEAGRVLRAQRDKPVEKPEPVTPRHEQNPRNKIYAELVESRKESSDLSQSDTDKPEEIKPEAPAPDAVAPASPPVDPPPSTEPVAAAPTVKVKVDGEEFEVPQSEVDEAGGVQSYRMVKAMENRLKKATDTATEARKTQEQTMQLLQSLFQQQRQPQVTPQQAAARKAELVEQMVYGDTQQKLAAYEELSKLNSGQQFDPQQFKQSLKVELAIQSSADKFKSEFADLISNPDILALATIKERQMLDKYNMSNLPASFDTEYRKIGNELRALVGRPTQPAAEASNTTTGQTIPATASPQGTPTSAKEERKASNIVSLPQASARATPKEKEELTPDQARNKALRDMRRARGQPTE